MDRRGFLQLGAAGAGMFAVGTTGCAPDAALPTTAFPQGVAAGLHSTDAVVLWTRAEPLVTGTDQVSWLVSTTPDLANVVASGTAPAPASADHTVKVLVEGLVPDRSYWYRFAAAGRVSPTGRARTLPPADAEPELLRLAFASCQSYATGYYGAWRDIAGRDLDAVVFLGDYIYESPAIQLARPLRAEPLDEALTLEQYRAKYRHYRSDADLQAAHAAHPWAIVWDDHELANDWDRAIYTTEPGRFEAASRAWFEYQPVWPIDGTRIHRSFRWGRLGELFMTDSRQYRDPELASLLGAGFLTAEAASADRTMLGTAQREWLLNGLSAAHGDGVRWKLLGNQQLFGPLRVYDLDTPELRALDPNLVKHAGFYLGLESWDQFPVERDTILEHLRTNDVGGAVVLTGDVHSFWAGGLRSDFDDESSPIVAHEFAGGAISSPPGGPHTALIEAGNTTLQPAWDFVDGTHNGFGLIECSPDGAEVSLWGLDAVYSAATASTLRTFQVPL